MSRVVLQEDISKDNLNASPRLRASKTTPLQLSTTWQVVDFSSVEANNTNTFPMMENGQQSVWWDSAGKKLVFNKNVDCNYQLTFYYQLTATLTGVDVHMRFCIPSPTPYYFPFPNGRGYKNLATAQGFTDFGDEYSTNIYADAPKRQYGLQIQVRQAASLLNMPQLASSYVIVYGD